MDYSIIRFRDGDIGIFVESDWAALRGWEERAYGMVELFTTPAAARQFVHAGEAEGYRFEGKEEWGHRGIARRPSG